MKRIFAALISVALVLVVTGCATSSDDEMHKAPKIVAVAIAKLEARGGSTAAGTVTFKQRDDGYVFLEISLTGVPEGVHGLHVHETGDCSAPDASSAGAHFNPTSHPHAGPGDPQHHAGDLGNVYSSKDGTATKIDYMSRSITLGEGPANVIGKAVVLHEKRDDLTTQPTGGSGARIACGVIQLGSPN